MSTLSNLTDMRKIIILQTIVEAGSLRKAATALKVTPSAVSQSLCSLEKQVGLPLIIRERGQFQQTQACLELLEKASPALSALTHFTLNEEEKPEIGRLDLGVYESLGIEILPKFMDVLREDHPKVKLNFCTARTGVLLQKLRSGELCTALLVENNEMETFKSELLFEDELGLYVSCNSPWADCGWEAVEELGLGSLSAGVDGHPSYYSRFIASLGKVKQVIASDSFEVLAALACHGSAVCVLPKRVAHRRGEDLCEITERPEGHSLHNGRHKIVLAYLERCDVDEAKYLARLVRQNI